MNPIRKPLNTRTGKLQLIDQSNAMYARPRTLKETRRDRLIRFFWTIAIALSVSYGAHHIAKGLPYVLAQHGVL